MAGRQRQDADTELIAKLIRWPADWVARIDEVRGEQSFSDFVRSAVLPQIDNGELSGAPQWGQGRPAIVTPEDVADEIRRVTEHEVSRHSKKRTA